MSDSKSRSFPIIFSCISLSRKHTHGGQTSKQLKRTKVIYSFPYVLLRLAGGDPSAGRKNFFLVSRESLTVIGVARGLLTPPRGHSHFPSPALYARVATGEKSPRTHHAGLNVAGKH